MNMKYQVERELTDLALFKIIQSKFKCKKECELHVKKDLVKCGKCGKECEIQIINSQR